MLRLASTDGYLAFDTDECRKFGRSLATQYQTASPFPHIVIDDFLPADVLRQVLADFPTTEGKAFFDRDQERFKFQLSPNDSSSAVVRNLFAELNGEAFLAFLEEMTGIAGLIPDPHFVGGGLHETKTGGHLGIHADFNIHEELKLERKLNLLIYLNEDWSDEFGGALELWDRSMQACEKKVAPVFGRAVVFNTALDSFHGHPDPLACPPERSRRSIATYYYAAHEEGLAALPKRNTNFQPRPGQGDRTDWQVRRQHFINDWVPPRLQRIAHRLFV
jgi:Rps23 Pro-64 3,4-dihydroxylase Tpa1-like proline 4-hydroxylase